MKVWKLAVVSVLALGLVLGMASPALAASEWASFQGGHLPPRVVKGEVVRIDDGKSSFVVQSGWQEVTISVDSATRYFKALAPPRVATSTQHLMKPTEPGPGGLGLMGRFHRLVEGALAPWGIPALLRHRLELGELVQEAPGLGRWLHPFGEEATFDDIAVGSRVVVWVVPVDEGNPLAKRVLIIEPTAYHRVLGTVINISLGGKTITVAPTGGGDDVILSYDEKTRFILRGTTSLEEGEQVRAVYDEEGMARVVEMVEGLD